MLTTLILLSSLAAVPGRQLPDADVVLHAPTVVQTSGVSAFLARAGARSPSLQSWQRLVYPLLEEAALSPERLTALGAAPGAPLTASIRGSRALACLSLADPAAFDARLSGRLASLGDPVQARVPGVDAAARVGEGAGSARGFVRRGKQACTWSAPVAEAAAAEREAAAALVRAAGANGTPAGLTFLAAGMQGRVDGSASHLSAKGRARLRELPALDAPGPSPYADTKAGGMAQLVLRLSPASARRALPPVIARASRLCRSCDAEVLRTAGTRLAAELTGQALLRLGEFRPTDAGLRSDTGRYRALPFALLLELRKGSDVAGLLAPLQALPMASKAEGGVLLSLGEGTALLLAARGGHLVVSSAPALAASLLADVPAAPGALAHAGVLTADPRELARALARIPLLEVLANPELAALLVASNELGPLLGQSRALKAGLDRAPGPVGSVAYDATWELLP